MANSLDLELDLMIEQARLGTPHGNNHLTTEDLIHLTTEDGSHLTAENGN